MNHKRACCIAKLCAPQLVCIAVAVLWAAGCSPKSGRITSRDALAPALKSFAGSWEIVTVRPAGATKDARRLVFTSDGAYAAQDAGGTELWAGTFEIDPTVQPAVWDHRSHAARRAGQDALGIYELENDKLKVACVVGQWKAKEWSGRPRPKAFNPQEADVLIELKRTKSSE